MAEVSAEFLDKYLGAPIPVVLAFAGIRQPIGLGLDKAPLDKPVHSPGRQHEDTVQPQCAGSLLDALEYPFAVALSLDLRRHRQRRHFRRLCFWIGIKRGATEYHAVVLDDGVVGDIALDF